MQHTTASSYPAQVHSHAMDARAAAGFAASSNWSAAFAATTAKRSTKRTARHLGTETT